MERGGTEYDFSGWSIAHRFSSERSAVYLKKNSNINLSGRKKTGKDSMMWTSYTTEVD